ncbi:hypothetical protein [Candidatus Uabimicrobium sp. HlEnr_7]|uniref:hypothetical protein n=1 Tax=Candidatus Uabimicrobium helgolandensis TaxID=3095367 RepID=UPI003558E78C
MKKKKCIRKRFKVGANEKKLLLALSENKSGVTRSEITKLQLTNDSFNVISPSQITQSLHSLKEKGFARLKKGRYFFVEFPRHKGKVLTFSDFDQLGCYLHNFDTDYLDFGDEMVKINSMWYEIQQNFSQQHEYQVAFWVYLWSRRNDQIEETCRCLKIKKRELINKAKFWWELFKKNFAEEITTYEKRTLYPANDFINILNPATFSSPECLLNISLMKPNKAFSIVFKFFPDEMIKFREILKFEDAMLQYEKIKNLIKKSEKIQQEEKDSYLIVHDVIVNAMLKSRREEKHNKDIFI